MNFKKLFAFVVFTLFVFFHIAFITTTWSANFPTKGITLVVPFPAGASTSLTAQTIANIVNKNKLCSTSMQVIFKPGGSGTIGVAEVLRGAPDGYTLSYTPSAPIIVQPLVKNLPYSIKTMRPFIQTAKFDWMLTVKEDSPFKTIQDFVEYAKQHPNEVRVATSGDYTWSHVALLNIAKASGLKFRVVTFSGGTTNMVAVLGGHVDAGVLLTGDAATNVQAGKLRFIATCEPQRSSFYPDVPSFNEIGYSTFGSYHTNVAIAPKDTPDETIKILHDVFKKAIDTDEYKAFLKKIGGQYAYIGYKELPSVIEEEAQKIKILLKELGKEINE